MFYLVRVGIPELQELIGVEVPEEEITDPAAFIEQLYSNLLNCDEEKVS